MLLNTCCGGIGSKADNFDSQVSHLFFPLDVLKVVEACFNVPGDSQNARNWRSSELLGRGLGWLGLTF